MITLATFNTHYGIVPVSTPPLQRYDVKPILGDLNADVLVVQEATRPDGESGDVDAFAHEHGYELHFALVGRINMDARWPRIHPQGEATAGVAVLTRLPSRRLDDIVLGPTPGDPAPRRVALQVELDVDGHPLQLIGLHLTSRLPHGPPLQLRRLAKALPPRGIPAVVAGDFNFWGPPVTALLPGWRRSAIGRTWPARAPHSQIDHVLVRPGDVQVDEGIVLGDVGSDHRPIRTVLRIRI